VHAPRRTNSETTARLKAVCLRSFFFIPGAYSS
jgi:hypothetical protein